MFGASGRGKKQKRKEKKLSRIENVVVWKLDPTKRGDWPKKQRKKKRIEKRKEERERSFQGHKGNLWLRIFNPSHDVANPPAWTD